MSESKDFIVSQQVTFLESDGPRMESLSAGLRRLSQWVHTRYWRLWATQRLTPTQLKVLQLLSAHDEGLSLTAVSRELGLSAATICDSVRALNRKGLVKKRRSTRDGRQQTLQLSAQGQEVVREATSSEPLLQAFEGLTPAEQQTLNVLWIKMIHALEEAGKLPPSCVRCKFFRPSFARDSQSPHFCGQMHRPLPQNVVRWDCSEFVADDPQAQAVVWEAFVAASLPPAVSEHRLEELVDNPAVMTRQEGFETHAHHDIRIE